MRHSTTTATSSKIPALQSCSGQGPVTIAQQLQTAVLEMPLVLQSMCDVQAATHHTQLDLDTQMNTAQHAPKSPPDLRKLTARFCAWAGGLIRCEPSSPTFLLAALAPPCRAATSADSCTATADSALSDPMQQAALWGMHMLRAQAA